jgi:FMN phosphatase YigB (HAD superfamily)
MHLNANEVVHIGDDPERDWKAAKAAGLSVFQLDRPRNSLRDLLNWVGRDSNPEPTPKAFGAALRPTGLQD